MFVGKKRMLTFSEQLIPGDRRWWSKMAAVGEQAAETKSDTPLLPVHFFYLTQNLGFGFLMDLDFCCADLKFVWELAFFV